MPTPLPQLRIASLVAGALLAVPTGAHAAISPARAEQAAKQAVAPLEVQSIACFRGNFLGPRVQTERYYCVAYVAARPGDTCTISVTVKATKRPRRVSAKVTIPLRCFSTPAPPLGA
jgi:hypothetical protein